MKLEKYKNKIIPAFESLAMENYMSYPKNIHEMAEAVQNIDGMINLVKSIRDLTPIVNRINELSPQHGDGTTTHPHDISILMYTILVMFTLTYNGRGQDAFAFAKDIFNKTSNLGIANIFLYAVINNHVKLEIKK